MISFFRYPGGKAKLRDQIIASLTDVGIGRSTEYREPFFGGGSIGLGLLELPESPTHVWINDKDAGIAALWTSVIRFPNELADLIMNFVPSVANFDAFKARLLTTPPPSNDADIVRLGFMKLAIHQISYSGLGTKSGGPLGGRHAENVAGTNSIKYPIDCRWSPQYICKKVFGLNKKFSSLQLRSYCCTSLDFDTVICDDATRAVIYLDPPYFVKGGDLYQHSFTESDHRRLAMRLRESPHRWLLSYDDCEEIRDLYSWANIRVIEDVNYSITATKDRTSGKRLARQKSELLISHA